MGYRLIFTSLSMMFLLTGCIVDKVWTTRYVYVNESGVEIVINQYFGDESLRNSDEISKNENFIIEYRDLNTEIPFSLRTKVDIIFNNDKKSTYTRSEKDKEYNPYEIDNYVVIPTNEKRTTVYEYTFTPEMYEEATPIEP